MTNKKLPLKLIFFVFIACVLASVGSFFYLDQWLAVHFSDPGLEEFWVLNRQLTDIGLSSNFFLFSVILFIALFIWGKYAKDHPEWRFPLQIWSAKFFLSLITSGIVVMVLKFIFGRQRPHKTSPEFDPTVFQPFNFHWDFQSLPSGHTQVVFCVATMLSMFFPRGTLIFVVLALLLGFTRVVTHAHFLSDCIMGAFFGWAVTLVTYRLILRKYDKADLAPKLVK